MFFHLGGCQNWGPLLGTLNNRCRIIVGTQKGAIILTTTHLVSEGFRIGFRFSDVEVGFRETGNLVLVGSK